MHGCNSKYDINFKYEKRNMTAVPALKRGFEILDLLNRHDALSLDEIASETHVPKASILRILDTLTELGAVMRLKERKAYRAVSLVMPRQQDFKQYLRFQLQELADKCDACVEWYEADTQGMRIVQRYSAPQNEVQVQARLGFIRQWYAEVEAVSLCALAFSDTLQMLPADAHLWSYDQDGEHRSVSQQELAQRLEILRTNQWVCDDFYNDHGVRRMAAPVFKDDRLYGIIALAMCFRPQLEKQLATKKEHLLFTSKQLRR